jgi:tetratricopeptide (TPR) repeat protein
MKLLFLSFLIACSSAHKIKISSPQGVVQVSLRDSSGQRKDLGSTPLELPATEVFNSNSRISTLFITKDGFTTQRLVLLKDNEKSETEISASLEALEKRDFAELQVRSERLAQGVAKGMNLASKKRWEEAQEVLLGLISEFPSVSVPYDLMGNIHYVKREYTEALRFYEKSYALNPSSPETKQMIERLKQGKN